MREYVTYKNNDGSYTTYEREASSSPNVMPYLFAIAAFFFLWPFSPIFYFVSKSLMKKYRPNTKKYNLLKILNKLFLAISICVMILFSIAITFFICCFIGVINVDFI